MRALRTLGKSALIYHFIFFELLIFYSFYTFLIVNTS